MSRTGTDDDSAAIRRTVLDYFEGWFEGDAGRMERALHPGLAKRSLRGREGGADGLDTITAGEMVEATTRGIGKQRAATVPDTNIEVRIDDLYDTITSVSVRSAVYHEYLHLVRTSAGWKIANALWQWTQPVGAST